MTDRLTKEQRSILMSRVKGRDTGIEKKLRSELHKRGHRFRKNVRKLPGSPDIVFTKKKIAIFIDGDFWHGYRFSEWKEKLSPFWKNKIEENIRRDKRNFAKLRRMEWKVIRVWGHDLKRRYFTKINNIVKMIRATQGNG